MKSFKTTILLCLITVAIAYSACLPCQADAISPHIGSSEKAYSQERPNAAYFGSGIAGRLSEASHLRFEGEHYMVNGNHDLAVRNLRKAVELDRGCPYGHFLLAKAMTKKIRASDPVDKKLLVECMQEWTLINRHDADHTHQLEARTNLRFLKKVARAIWEKEHPEEAKKKKKRSFLAGSKKLFGVFKRKEKSESDIMNFSL